MKTLAELCDEYLERPRLSERTKRSYLSVFRPLLDAMGPVPVSDISREDLERHFADRDLKWSSLNTHIATVRALFGYAVDREYATKNPAYRLERRVPQRARGEVRSERQFRHLTPEGRRLLYEELDGQRRRHSCLHALVALVHSTGARIEEALSIDLADLDFATYSVPVVGKGNKERTLYFSPDVAAVLRAYIQGPRERILLESRSDALFLERQPKSAAVTRLRYTTARRELQELSCFTRVFGGPGGGFHTLRHDFATLRADTMELDFLQRLMGHSKLDTTTIYREKTPEVLRDAAARAHSALNERILGRK